MSSSFMTKQLKQIIINATSKSGYTINIDEINIEPNLKNNLGDYSCVIAMQLAKKYEQLPMKVAENIVKHIDLIPLITKITISKPGYINFFIDTNQCFQLLQDIHTAKDNYGCLADNGQHYNIEFVSANPTGYLHLGHARNAAIGDSLSRILIFSGYQVTREYYLNDAGNQIDMLANSIFVRYQNLCGNPLELPEDSYHGQDIVMCAQSFYDQYHNQYQNKPKEELLSVLKNFGINYMLEQIKIDLKNYNVVMDVWSHESHLYQDGSIIKTLKKLSDTGNSYFSDGATWLRSTSFGDDKDRVLIKSDGTYTYMLPDLSYHDNKYYRCTMMVNVWGADHYGYIARIRSGLEALGDNPNHLTIVPTQMVRLIKDGSEHKMSKRAGTTVSMRDLLNQVGSDFLRFFMICRTSESHLDIDISIASKQDQQNPVYYLQYAHARIHQVDKNAKNYGIPDNIKLLTHEKEKELLLLLDEFVLVLAQICKKLQPHLMVNYLQKLAKTFHSYYNECKIILDQNQDLTNQRLFLVKAVQIIIASGLSLIGVSAPNQM